MAESIHLEDIETGKKSKHCRYFKMKVLKDHTAGQVDNVVEQNLDSKTIVFSDKSSSYVNIADYVEVHILQKSSRQTTVTTLKWVHIAISNAKRWLLGNHHMIKAKYLQNHLNEFCYKLNRRYFGHRLFDRVTIALAKFLLVRFNSLNNKIIVMKLQISLPSLMGRVSRTLITFALLFLCHFTYSQCPNGVEIAANGKCTNLSWIAPVSPPAQLPMSILVDGDGQDLVSSMTVGGTTTTAIYENPINSGGCNNFKLFTGTIVINGVDCQYIGGVLPVNLISLYVTANEGQVEIKWMVASQTNNKGFLVQRSFNGREWTTIGDVGGLGTSTMIKEYSFIDQEPYRGINYYRLKQVDFDGRESVSDVKQVQFDRGELKFFPNPFQDRLQTVGLAAEDNVELIRFDGLHIHKMVDRDGVVDTSDLIEGVYLLKVENALRVNVYTVVKL